MKCFCVLKQKDAYSRAEQAFEARKELKSDNSPNHPSSKSDNSPNHRASKSDNSPSRRTSKVTDPRPSLRTIPEMYEQKGHNLTVFSYSELKYATNGFHKLLKIGEGGFGCVYKGIVRSPDGQGDPPVVAIKKLTRNGLQGHKQWLAEVQFLGVLEHPNLVKLLGHCSVDVGRYIERLLVYEYMPNKSLEAHLFNLALSPLSWKTRLQIMLGAAQGLAYLHEGLECQVIYRDFKSSNVLLDENFNPKLSDFGLARQGPTEDRSHVTTGVLGTYGYAAPEYLNTGRLSVKSDVWSFGVVLYEILTGRRTVERERPSPLERKLLDWVKYFPVNTDKFWGIIDRRLRNNYSLSAARKIGRLADRCVKENKNDRPTISEVVKTLKEAIEDTEEEESCSEIRISLSSSRVERVTLNEITDFRPMLTRCSSANSQISR